MIEATPADPVDLMVIEEPGDQSPLSILDIILSNPLPNNIKPKETPHLNLESARMNVEIVDDIMRDPFSSAPKALQLSPQPLAVRVVADFQDSSQVALDNISHDNESDHVELELNLDLYEGLLVKAVNEVAM